MVLALLNKSNLIFKILFNILGMLLPWLSCPSSSLAVSSWIKSDPVEDYNSTRALYHQLFRLRYVGVRLQRQS